MTFTLTTFNPNYFNTGLEFFKIKKIEIKNLKILNKKEINKIFFNELTGSNLFVINQNKFDKILKDNELIDFIELRKIYPSKIEIMIHEKEVIAIIT